MCRVIATPSLSPMALFQALLMIMGIIKYYYYGRPAGWEDYMVYAIIISEEFHCDYEL